MTCHRSTTQGRSAGFTLVEVLVALLIMAVIAAMGWQGVSGMSRASQHGAAATERTLRLAALVEQFEQDLQALYDSAQLPGLQFDGASLRIARRTEGGVQVVVWALHDGIWQRWAGAAMTRRTGLAQAWLASLQLQGGEAGQLRLLDGVAGWQIYFYRGQGWSNAQSSGDVVATAAPPPVPASGASAPAAVTQRTQLPSGVRLQIDLPEGRLTRDVMLGPQLP